MAEMAVLVDTSRCTGCRGCQVACKQWNKNPATETCFVGSYENPPNLDSNTFTRVTFREVEDESGKLCWLFRKVQCRHCVEPPCVGVPEKTPMKRADNGAVVVDQGMELTQEEFEEVRDACPGSVPKYDEQTKTVKKCNFCVDRQEMGKKPACVTACLSDTLFFGTRKEVIAEGNKRLAKLKTKFPKAELYDSEECGWIYILTQEEE